jgi:hypothetical protein
MKTFIAISTIGTLIIYLMFSFVLWDLNAGHWLEGTRAFFSFVIVAWISISPMISAAIHESKSDDK